MSNKTIAEMSGEALRECGVLIAVFGMLDKFLRDVSPTAAWTASVFGLALSAFALGCMIERRRN